MYLHYFSNIVCRIRISDILALFLSFFRALQTVLSHGTKQPSDAFEHAHFKPRVNDGIMKK